MISRQTIMTFLTISAVILACVLVLQHTLPGSRAYAGDGSRAGDFIAATTVVDGSSEVLWLINVRSQTLGVFALTREGFVQPLAATALAAIFPPVGGFQGQQPFGQPLPQGLPPQTPTPPAPFSTLPAEPETTEESAAPDQTSP